MTGADWIRLFVLGLVGHVAYQLFFIGGLARTSVANSSLMLAVTPVLIAIISAVLGHERISRIHWIGAAVSDVPALLTR
jgi:drug/metabolite transporter (DMT)-like permease